MRKPFAQPAVRPCAGNGTKQCNDYHQKPAANLSEERPGASTGDGPTHTEHGSANDVAPVKLSVMKYNFLALYSFDVEFFDDQNGECTHHHRGSDYPVHVKRMEPEHFLDAVPGNNFCLNKNNPKKKCPLPSI